MRSPALSRVRVRFGVVILGPRPSLHQLRRGLRLFVRQLHRYYGAVRLLHRVHVRRSVIGLPGPVCSRRRDGDLPVLVHVVSRRAGVFDYAGPGGNSRLALRVSVAFPLTEKGRHPVLRFRSSIAQPADASVYASPATSRQPMQDSRSRWSRFSLPVGLFHPLQHAGLSWRTLSPVCPNLLVPHAATIPCPRMRSYHHPPGATSHRSSGRGLPPGAFRLAPDSTPQKPKGPERILIARGGSLAVLSPRWVMWQETPAARIVNQSSLETCAVQALPIPPFAD